MNKKMFEALGFSSVEEKIYNVFIKTGESTPVKLSKITGIKRTTIYHIVRSLVEKGFLVSDNTKRPVVFKLASSKDIEAVIDNEERNFDQRRKNLEIFAGELSKVSAEKDYPVPRIRFVEEERLEKFLYSETPKWHKSIIEHDSTWWGFQDHTFLDNYSKITEWYWWKIKEPIFVKLLTNQSETENKFAGKFPNREVKFWNKTGNFISTTWVIGDYVIMINTRQHPFYLIEMHNIALANDQREIYKNLWSLI